MTKIIAVLFLSLFLVACGTTKIKGKHPESGVEVEFEHESDEIKTKKMETNKGDKE